MLDLNLHAVQWQILNFLSHTSSAKFSDLNISGLTNDHFTFHIKRLIGLELIHKNEDGIYELTIKGKEFIGSVDFNSQKEEKRSKINVMLVIEKIEDGTKKYLMQKRLRQPYFEYLGMITTRVKKGEKYHDVAKDILLDQAGVTADLKLIGIKHKMDQMDGETVEDIVFFIFKAENISGEVKTKAVTGENFWLTFDEIKNSPKIFPDVVKTLEIINSNELNFSEEVYDVREF